MPLVQSQMLPLGTVAPDFDLPDAHGKRHTLQARKGPSATLVMFLCPHCPYVQHVRGELAAIGRDYAPRGVGLVGINSNDVNDHPDDSPAHMLEEIAAAGYPFPYLIDASQAVAKSYRAACTPDLFLFDARLQLVYRGQLDGSRPGNGVPVTGRDLRAALDALLAGRAVPERQLPSAGCNIKWTRGREPEWFRGR